MYQIISEKNFNFGNSYVCWFDTVGIAFYSFFYFFSLSNARVIIYYYYYQFFYTFPSNKSYETVKYEHYKIIEAMLQAKKYGTGEKGHKSHILNSIMKIINKNKTIKTILINPLRTKGEATRKNSINMVKKI